LDFEKQALSMFEDESTSSLFSGALRFAAGIFLAAGLGGAA
jgi:hypothetical protein